MMIVILIVNNIDISLVLYPTHLT